MPILQVADSSFHSEVIKSNSTVLVDFWAPWCGPCRMIAPVIDEIANEYQDIIKVVKVNTDLNPIIASEYGIRSIPTLMIFKEGIKVDTVIGAVPRSTLVNTLSKHI
uniref:Thioredoxin n=1 Tax=Ophidocladus simpliciusculus TaxID=1261574 RepID=A0A1Z1MIR9_9FLOR|nr:thioredoxin [Ophidocladus simpliciusculus]ARW65970.1 thioredoxin [Ophidocladus simpliciusculus]